VPLAATETKLLEGVHVTVRLLSALLRPSLAVAVNRTVSFTRMVALGGLTWTLETLITITLSGNTSHAAMVRPAPMSKAAAM
jgi:hypothetical protein